MAWWVLGAWTAVAAVWWIVAIALVARPRPCAARGTADQRRISIFKPVPGALNADQFGRIVSCVESFAAALDDESELLIGYDAPDRTRLERAAASMRQRYPAARIRLIAHAGRDHCANPKVSRMKDLAAHATGDLWLWSDADIMAPNDLLASLRRDFADGAGVVLCPYIIPDARAAHEYLDAFFVNAEFYPGVLLLARANRLQVGFGSGMLFEASEFRRRIDWTFLGSCLADDYHLGRALGRGRLGRTRVASLAGARNWREACSHYLRWHKTIRWNQPVPYALQLAVMPLAGWLVWLAMNPTHPGAWMGVLAVVVAEGAAATWLCRILGCPVRLRHLPAAGIWSVARVLAWMFSWLPLSVLWGGRKWRRPYQVAPGVE